MDTRESFVALVIYPSTPAAQVRRAATSIVGELHPRAYWLRPHASVEAP